MAAFTYAALIAVALLNGCTGAALVVAGLGAVHCLLRAVQRPLGRWFDRLKSRWPW